MGLALVGYTKIDPVVCFLLFVLENSKTILTLPNTRVLPSLIFCNILQGPVVTIWLGWGKVGGWAMLIITSGENQKISCRILLCLEKNLGHFVSENYYASPIADSRYGQMPEVQLAAGG